jgi:anti-sigma factor RsiW
MVPDLKPLNCRDVIWLAPLYVSGELEGARAAECDRHLRTCPSCIEQVERQARLDARLREVLLTQETDVAEVDRRVRDLVAAAAKGHKLPPLEPRWRRWATLAMGFAAALVLSAAGYESLGTRVPRIYAEAATDHRLEVSQLQPRPWFTEPGQIVDLAARQGVAPAAVKAITSRGYRLVRAKLCYLDHRIFLHLVLSDGASEFSLYLRQRDAEPLSGPVREIANGKPLCTSEIDNYHLASLETPALLAVLVTDHSSEAALNLARFAAAVL